MGLKNLPPPKTPKKTSSIDDIEMNISQNENLETNIQEVQEEKKEVHDILELNNETDTPKKNLTGNSTPSSQKEENDNFSNVSNAGSQRTSDLQQSDKLDIISEADIEPI